jgi:hypothetical protein
MRAHRWCLLLALSACGINDGFAPPPAPTIALVADEVWQWGSLSVVSPEVASSTVLPTFVVDDTITVDTLALSRHGDTTVVRLYCCRPGIHAIQLRLGSRRSLPVPFTVHGIAGDTATPVPEGLVSRPLPMGAGSAMFWVGTARGLAQLDPRYVALGPQLVDSTVDPSCLYAIGPSAVAGAVVVVERTAAGCGVLRARRYGATVQDVDSGPPAAGWRWAVHGGNGVWLLATYDTVALAVRGADGSWSWTRWPRNGGTWDDFQHLALSPRGDRAVAFGWGDGFAGVQDALVFDLQHATLAYMLPSARGVTFAPTGDTLVYATVLDSLIRVDATTGVRAGPAVAGVPGWFSLVYDPYGPWLYAVALDHDSPTIIVVDRRTWSHAGRIGIGWGGIPWVEAVLAVAGYPPRLWMLWAFSTFAPPLNPQRQARLTAFSVPGR